MTDEQAHERVERYLARGGRLARGARAVPLTGDASDRYYVRILTPGEPSVVLAIYPAPFDPDTLPYLNVTRLLRAMGVPIPEVIDHAADLGILAQEDLGDVTLQAHLGSAPWLDHAALYREAVSLIVTLQERSAGHASDAYLPFHVAFDAEKLTWELEFFLKHFLVGYRGAAPDGAASDAIRAEFAGIADELASEPRVLCHRDYHSRNLMLHAGRLYTIDYQDARMGPDTYDLVSLLRDSYVDLPPVAVGELVAYFLALKGRPADEKDFLERFDVMALQRNLKALGTFGYQTITRENPVYIQYIPRTLTYVRDNLRRHPRRFGRLHELLAAHVGELR